jgi:uncharacterized damage-inducible protein DinB
MNRSGRFGPVLIKESIVKERKLILPEGYDPNRQRIVGMFAAQFDDQLRLLREALAELETKHLEWQPHPGLNTIGMLLAHLAVVEVFWINVAAQEIPLEPKGDDLILATIGIRMDDDGLPLATDGRHPATLAGKKPADYLKMLEQARHTIHATLRTWNDSDLTATYFRREREITISREWTLYHVLEHFAAHFGQILLLKHLMRDAGLLPLAAKV